MQGHSQAHTTYWETNEAIPLRPRSGDSSTDTYYVIFLNNCPGALMPSFWQYIPGWGSEVADALDTNLIEHYHWLVGRWHSYWFLSTWISCIIVKHWWESGFSRDTKDHSESLINWIYMLSKTEAWKNGWHFANPNIKCIFHFDYNLNEVCSYGFN